MDISSFKYGIKCKHDNNVNKPVDKVLPVAFKYHSDRDFAMAAMRKVFTDDTYEAVDLI